MLGYFTASSHVDFMIESLHYQNHALHYQNQKLWLIVQIMVAMYVWVILRLFRERCFAVFDRLMC